MTNIYIARHGETEYNRTGRIQGRGINESINKTGRQQAVCVANSLREADIHHIFSSSLNRSVETAQIISDHLNVPLQSYKELDEMDFGVIEGKPINEIGDDLDQLHTHWSQGNTTYALDDGESPEVVFERADKRARILANQHQGKNLLYVLHGRLIRILLSQWLEYGLQQMHHIEHCNGALYHVRINGDERIEPVFLDKREHLEAGS